jgi:hypothetical protein
VLPGRSLYPVLAAVIVSLAAPSAPARGELRVLREGERLAPVTLSGPEGQQVTVPPVPPPAAPGENGVGVVVFWASWSPRSAPLLALWQKLSSDYSSHPFRVVTVAADHQEMDAERRAAVGAFLAGNKITLPVGFDEDLALYNRIGVVALPTTLFFRADGSLSHEEPGFPSSADVDLPAALEKELGIARAEAVGEHRGRLAYQPKNNALLYHQMGINLAKMKMAGKARGKFVEALQRDPDYPDPLQSLEDDLFRDGRTPQALQDMRDLLNAGKLPALAERYQ